MTEANLTTMIGAIVEMCNEALALGIKVRGEQIWRPFFCTGRPAPNVTTMNAKLIAAATLMRKRKLLG